MNDMLTIDEVKEWHVFKLDYHTKIHVGQNKQNIPTSWKLVDDFSQ
jgi:hypothetical protein